MLHYKRKVKIRKTKKTSANRFNTKKKSKNFANAKKRAKIRNTIFYVIAGAALFAGVYFTSLKLINLIQKNKVPGEEIFSSCSDSFISIKTKPVYGVILNTENESVKSIVLTAPNGQTSIKTITIDADSWLIVYFSPNFTFTQVEGLLRLSRLEVGEISPCYILEQLSLSSGVPIEYAIIRDKNEGISSTLKMNEVEDILINVDKESEDYEFKEKLLPLYLLGDGTEVHVITYAAFLEQFPDFFKIDEIANEQAFLEVYNVTDIAGYASIASKRWEMLGIDVSRVGNASHEKLEGYDAVIYVRDVNLYSRTLGMIKSSFDPARVKIIEGRPSSVVSTGDIVVFLLNR